MSLRQEFFDQAQRIFGHIYYTTVYEQQTICLFNYIILPYRPFICNVIISSHSQLYTLTKKLTKIFSLCYWLFCSFINQLGIPYHHYLFFLGQINNSRLESFIILLYNWILQQEKIHEKNFFIWPFCLEICFSWKQKDDVTSQ